MEGLTNGIGERFGNQRVVHPLWNSYLHCTARFETCAPLGTVLGLTTTAMTHHTTGTLRYGEVIGADRPKGAEYVWS